MANHLNFSKVVLDSSGCCFWALLLILVLNKAQNTRRHMNFHIWLNWGYSNESEPMPVHGNQKIDTRYWSWLGSKLMTGERLVRFI